ncbi:hypothetical protein KOY48_03600 [Candidatus Minimicrobia naudis]|uniref:DNA polymerase III alpha subunit finger domain-containing protein n=1 Tax=Candidatus Minimicrobia naudis TaxID=2841263 RepID=A0A8F1MCD8_9BACT|nr:hypothetical protein KOY48_03600 [Candidatus Minimicrobia naudis]
MKILLLWWLFIVRVRCGFIGGFIRRKHRGEEEITYLHSGMKNSLKNTYGILVYQGSSLCRFLGNGVDLLVVRLTRCVRLLVRRKLT